MAALAMAGSALFGAAAAQAQQTAPQVPCESLPDPLYGSGGSAGTNLVKRIAIKLAAANQGTVIFSDTGACQAMTDLGAKANGVQPPLTLAAKYWTAAGLEGTCTYAAGSAIVSDWGMMAQLPSTCTGVTALPTGVSDNVGPISGLSIIVPNLSSEYAISAEAVYYIYGLQIGNNHDVTPWTNVAAVGARSSSSAVGLLLRLASGIPDSRQLTPYYHDVKDNAGAVSWITKESQAAVATPSAAIAFASLETIAALNPPTVRTLAFKAKGQDYAYLPDTDATTPDKKNLREGRYFLWNPHHFYAVNAQLTAKPSLKKFIDIATSKAELPDGQGKYLDLQITNGNVPWCAMKVTRATDVGPLSPFKPEHSCGCYFETKATGKKPDACKECTTNDQCSSGQECSYGYCEVK